jgi:hypothetical protein
MRLYLFLIASLVWAQSESGKLTISGVVTDPAGALVPEAAITLSQPGVSRSRATRSDASGRFRFPNLSPGGYKIEVQRVGFRTASLAVSITDQSAVPLRIALELTDVRQEVTVNDTTERVSTAASDNGGAVSLDRSLLDSLPIFDQNYVSALQRFLDPGSVSTGGVTLIVNGVEQKNIGVSASAIQQVKINQNPYSAEYSRPGRGAIEIVTKPASQSFHGTFNSCFATSA